MQPFCFLIVEVPVTEPSSRRSGYARLLDRAIRILAMRDHSEQELRRKTRCSGTGQKWPGDAGRHAGRGRHRCRLVH
ncbi:Regulatory protein recX [Raoultella planticola]|uniref:Regulatory protein recX n=1 Tax=Raoultella planticola TaxID=575 RepID=A0A485BXT1_RAOPL|nr:Regulatory protein recX [Raoultella planticola]